MESLGRDVRVEHVVDASDDAQRHLGLQLRDAGGVEHRAGIPAPPSGRHDRPRAGAPPGPEERQASVPAKLERVPVSSASSTKRIRLFTLRSRRSGPTAWARSGFAARQKRQTHADQVRIQPGFR
jgi:hypothetical protein